MAKEKICSKAQLKKAEQNGYSRGYQAGKRKGTVQKIIEKIETPHEIRMHQQRHDRLMIDAMKFCIKECSGWQIDQEKVSTMGDYAKLAKVMVDNVIGKNPHG